MTALDDLRQAAELLPAGASVTLTREALLAAIGTGRDETTQVLRDELTVTDLAAQFQRSASTVRGWIEAGRFPGAYKLRGRDWRVTRAAVDVFRAHERGRPSQQTRRSRRVAAALAPDDPHRLCSRCDQCRWFARAGRRGGIGRDPNTGAVRMREQPRSIGGRAVACDAPTPTCGSMPTWEANARPSWRRGRNWPRPTQRRRRCFSRAASSNSTDCAGAEPCTASRVRRRSRTSPASAPGREGGEREVYRGLDRGEREVSHACGRVLRRGPRARFDHGGGREALERAAARHLQRPTREALDGERPTSSQLPLESLPPRSGRALCALRIRSGGRLR